MARVAIGFGSNLGDRNDHLGAGFLSLARHWKPVSRSGLYESEPVGPVEQGAFLNAVAVFETAAEPGAVLAGLLGAEETRGRTRDVRWGPRTLDLDLLLYGDREVNSSGLTVPHPEMASRRFVLDPLLEAWPEAALPDGTPLGTFVPAIADQKVVRVGDWSIGRLALSMAAVRRLLKG
ncbi:MAG: 2-amino-4-hydroxy-6-hydroxymethyldihydropteridine diphosphokinase [Acidimicrobiia bacterium]